MATELDKALAAIQSRTDLTQAQKTAIKQQLKQDANRKGELGPQDRARMQAAVQAALKANAKKPGPNPGPKPPNPGPDPGTGLGPQPTEPPGDGFYWGPNPEGNGWILTPIPGYEPPKPPGPDPGFSDQDKEGAKQRLKNLLLTYGLVTQADIDGNTGMWKTVNDLITTWGGRNDDVIMSYLRESVSYKQRFKGNTDRIRNGYGALSEAEYISVETSIRAKMRDFGMDGAFYTNDRVASLIGGDVSADEVGDRLTKAKRIVDSADTNIKTSLVTLYGASMGDLIGYVLDPLLAQESLTRKVNAGIAYGVAKGQGFNLGVGLSEQIGELTYGDERTARQQFGQAGDTNRSVQRLKYLDGIDITDTDVAESQFGLDQEATSKVKTLASRERGRFTGTSGITSGSLANTRNLV